MHSGRLHMPVSLGSPKPQPASGTGQKRLRDCVPVPHVTLHCQGPHAVHVPQVPLFSVGQNSLLEKGEYPGRAADCKWPSRPEAQSRTARAPMDKRGSWKRRTGFLCLAMDRQQTASGLPRRR